MTALADALRALVPFADDEASSGKCASDARDVFRKHAPCDVCNGRQNERKPEEWCWKCGWEGWTPASVEAAIARAEEQKKLDHAVIDAAGWVVDNGIVGPKAIIAKAVAARRERQPIL